ncbi:MAG: hypothetical protein NWE95_02710 [Candidatus Bathyarchaeota archaeon]|nr:hypothetical protein [Candidatus Bathyarchaeota archaeon]
MVKTAKTALDDSLMVVVNRIKTLTRLALNRGIGAGGKAAKLWFLLWLFEKGVFYSAFYVPKLFKGTVGGWFGGRKRLNGSC